MPQHQREHRLKSVLLNPRTDLNVGHHKPKGCGNRSSLTPEGELQDNAGMKGNVTLTMGGRARSIVGAHPSQTTPRMGHPLKVMRFAALVRTQMH